MPRFPPQPDARPQTDARVNSDALLQSTDVLTLPVVQEEFSVDKQVIDTGLVRVRTVTSSHQETVEMPLEREDVLVERVAVGRAVDAPVDARQEGDVLIVPVHEEVIVVHRQLMLKEELHIRRRVSTVQAAQPVVLRRQDVSIEREAVGGATPTH